MQESERKYLIEVARAIYSFYNSKEINIPMQVVSVYDSWNNYYFNIELMDIFDLTKLQKREHIAVLCLRLGIEEKDFNISSGGHFIRTTIPKPKQFKTLLTVTYLEQKIKKIEPLEVPFGITENIPITISIGKNQANILIVGAPGMGKSNALKCLLYFLIKTMPENSLEIYCLDTKNELTCFRKKRNVLSIDTQIKDIERTLIALNHKLHNRISKQVKEPTIIIACDELANLLRNISESKLTEFKEILELGRAFSFRFIGATQHPTSDNIPPDILALLQYKICYQVANSRISGLILGAGSKYNAGELYGDGDMIIKWGAKEIRGQTALVTEQDIEKLSVSTQKGTQIEVEKDSPQNSIIDDKLFQRLSDLVKTNEYLSISLLQRELSIGTDKATEIFNLMVGAGAININQQNKYSQKKFIPEKFNKSIFISTITSTTTLPEPIPLFKNSQTVEIE